MHQIATQCGLPSRWSRRRFVTRSYHRKQAILNLGWRIMSLPPRTGVQRETADSEPLSKLSVLWTRAHGGAG